MDNWLAGTPGAYEATGNPDWGRGMKEWEEKGGSVLEEVCADKEDTAAAAILGKETLENQYYRIGINKFDKTISQGIYYCIKLE